MSVAPHLISPSVEIVETVGAHEHVDSNA